MKWQSTSRISDADETPKSNCQAFAIRVCLDYNARVKQKASPGLWALDKSKLK